ncbi:MAG: UDP-2,3-diacylglucosamine diphosphatase [Gammaproteobacteria bacterium]|jgi:UDP-2,3-diacylglucosamine hydrolase|nr:UDP-2,3-diacylglucosamine diphosphatase [Gammaproteobacteria bacterium]
MTALFVADLHLDPSRPAATDSFLRFLAGTAGEASDLYVLGDLFEAWTGDDTAGEHDRLVLDAMARCVAGGTRGHLIRGNRDFLLGAGFTARTGFRLLPEESVVELPGARALLMHGDSLCTDDRAYQRYRGIVRRPAIQSLYLTLPARVRAGIAGYARRRSSAANAGKPAAIMDVNPEAVAAALRRHHVHVLIHGHTHRPAIHEFVLDGAPARRIVLADWHARGSALAWTQAGPELTTFEFG